MKQVNIPSDYFFKMSIKDYSNFKMALIREFFQNSTDANAKQIVFDIDKENSTLTVFDDGHGMSKDIIENKLLCLGESYKNNSNAVGAFGHAKLLLYFSWQEWTIETKDYKVFGEGHYYKIIKTDDYVDGTISQIKIPNNEYITLEGLSYVIIDYIKNCECDCNVYIYKDGELNKINSELIKGEQIYTDDNFAIYKNKENIQGFNIVVRQNGIKMFSSFMNKKDIIPIVEIKKSPYEMLLQNRDYFKKGYDDLFHELTRQLSVDYVDTFSANNNKSIPENVTVNNMSMLFYNKTNEDIDPDKLLKLKRNRRLLNILKEYHKYMKRNHSYIPSNIEFGFIIDNNIIGLAKNPNMIFINPNYFKQFAGKYRQMAIMLYHVLIHEIAHLITYDKHNSMSHDEDFSKTRENLIEVFWDTIPFVNIFKKAWKETK